MGLKYYCTIKIKQPHALLDIQSFKTNHWPPITQEIVILFICVANLLTYKNPLGGIYLTSESWVLLINSMQVTCTCINLYPLQHL